MERLPARRATDALARGGESLAISAARVLGRCYRRLHIARFVQVTRALYTPKKIAADGVLLGGAIYLVTSYSVFAPAMIFALMMMTKIFYYLGYALLAEARALGHRYAAKMSTLNMLMLVAATALLALSFSSFHFKVYLVVVAMLIAEAIAVFTWYARWVFYEERLNDRYNGLARVFEPQKGSLLAAFFFVTIVQGTAFIMLVV